MVRPDSSKNPSPLKAESVNEEAVAVFLTDVLFPGSERRVSVVRPDSSKSPAPIPLKADSVFPPAGYTNFNKGWSQH